MAGASSCGSTGSGRVGGGVFFPEDADFADTFAGAVFAGASFLAGVAASAGGVALAGLAGFATADIFFAGEETLIAAGGGTAAFAAFLSAFFFAAQRACCAAAMRARPPSLMPRDCFSGAAFAGKVFVPPGGRPRRFASGAALEGAAEVPSRSERACCRRVISSSMAERI